MGLRYRTGICAFALLAGSTVMSIEPAVLRDIASESGGGRIAVGAVRVSLWNAAFAQSAESVSLDNVRVTLGTKTYEAKRIELSGVSSSRAEIEALFAPGSTEPLESRLKRINARQISIPDLQVRQSFGKGTQTSTYRNTVLKDIVEGRIASVIVETSAAQSNTGENNVLVSSGRTSIEALDLPALARLYETKAEGASAPLMKIYGGFSVENLELTDSTSGIVVKVASLGGRDVSGRQTKDSWNGTEALFNEMAERQDLSSEDQARLLPAIADMMDAFQIGFLEATGIEVTPTGKGASGQARIARIAYTGGTQTQPADVRWEGFEFSDDKNRIKLDSMSVTGFSFRQTLDGLRTLQVKSLDDLDEATARSLVPTLGTLRLSGFSFDGVTDSDGRKARVQAALKGFELTADKAVNAVPTNIRIGLQNFTMALPSNSKDDSIRELVALGYKNIDISVLAAAAWNETTNEIVLHEVSFQGEDMGSIVLSGLIGNVGKDVFDTDTAIASVALMAGRAKSLDLVVDNKGLFERYMAKAAKEQKSTPEALRRTYATATAFVVPAMIGNSEQAQTLSQAIGRFIAKPGRLTVSARSKDSSGMSLVDFMMFPEPATIVQKLDITAKAE